MPKGSAPASDVETVPTVALDDWIRQRPGLPAEALAGFRVRERGQWRTVTEWDARWQAWLTQPLV